MNWRAYGVTLLGLLSGLVSAQQRVTVVEYYHQDLDSYFLTSRENEKQLLDGLPQIFRRTGASFEAYAAVTAPANMRQICRIWVYLPQSNLNTHFYGQQGLDCEPLMEMNEPGFLWEDYDFAVVEPNEVAPRVWQCPEHLQTVYRSYRTATTEKTGNHRYSMSEASYQASQAANYAPEQAAFCVYQLTDVTASP